MMRRHRRLPGSWAAQQRDAREECPHHDYVYPEAFDQSAVDGLNDTPSHLSENVQPDQQCETNFHHHYLFAATR